MPGITARARSLLALVDLRQFEPNARLFFAFGVPYFSGMGLFTLLYNLYLKRLGYQEDFIGLLAGMTPLSSGLCAVPVGVWSDRLGRKPFLMGAAIVLALAQTGLCLTTHRGLLLLFGFLGGLSSAMVFVNHVPYLAENCRPEHRGPLISLGFAIQILTRMAVSLVGGALPALFGALLGVAAGDPAAYRAALLLGAAVTALSALPVARIREGRDERGREGVRERGSDEDRAALRGSTHNVHPPHSLTPSLPHPLTPSASPWPLLLTLAAVSAFRGLSMGMSLPFFNVFFASRFHAPAAVIGTIFFASQLASLPSAVTSSRLAHRFGVIPLLMVLRLVMALALAVMGAASGMALALPLFLLYTACEGAGTPVEMAFATDAVARSHWGRAQSLRVMAYQLLSATGSIFAGKLIVRAGYPLTFLLAAALVLGSVAVLAARFSHLRTVDAPVKRPELVADAAE